MALDRNDCIYKELEHLRVVTFSLMIISTTLILLIIASWGYIPELAEDLYRFKASFDQFSDEKTTPSKLNTIAPFASEVRFPIFHMPPHAPPVRFVIEEHIDEIAIFKQQHSWGKLDSLAKIWAQIKQAPWQIQVISRFEMEQAFTDKCSRSLDRISKLEDSYHDSALSTSGASVDKSYIVVKKIEISRWPQGPQQEQSGVASLLLEIVHEGWQTGTVRDIDGSNQFLAPVKNSESCLVPVKIYISEQSIRSNISKWLGLSFRYINKYWNRIADKNIEEAIKWCSDEKAKSINSQKASFLGFSMHEQGEPIIWLGLVLAFVCQIYLLIYLIRLNKFLKMEAVPSFFLSPWLLTEQAMRYRLLKWVSLLVLPIIAIILSSWRILDLRWYVIIAVSLPNLLASIASGLFIDKISKQFQSY